MKRLTSIPVIACFVGCATPSTQTLSSITVIQRHPYIVCAGYCPDLDVMVREDGQVTLFRHHSHDPSHIERLRVTAEQAAQFRQILGPHRPAIRDAGPTACEFWNTPDPGVIRVLPYEVTWTDAKGSASRLRSCGGLTDRSLPETIREALWAIGLYMGGQART